MFVIGGAYGHGSAVRQRANDSLCLSSLVLNHEVALVVLLEQIYRRVACNASCRETGTCTALADPRMSNAL